MRNPQKKNKPVPEFFARCLNEKCTQADSCLRRLALSQTTPETRIFSIINPESIPQDTTKCTSFISSRKLRMAWGMKHLLDNVPYKTAYSIRNNLIGYYENRIIIAVSGANATSLLPNRPISASCSCNME